MQPVLPPSVFRRSLARFADKFKKQETTPPNGGVPSRLTTLFGYLTRYAASLLLAHQLFNDFGA